MSLAKTVHRIRRSALFALLMLGASTAVAQTDCVTYQYLPQTVYETVPTTQSRWVNETVYETQQITSYKPVWQTETRERKTTVLKPIYKTGEREEKYIVRRPVVETTYEEREIRETTYETVTEMREQRYWVEKPVVETEYREERHVVRKPTTKKMLKTENVVVYQPMNVSETQYVPSIFTEAQWVANPSAGGRRLGGVTPGYYVDPNTGQVLYTDPGLVWTVQPELEIQRTLAPTLTPQVVNRTEYVPQTVQRQTPVEITTYEEVIETRRVPIQIQKMTKTIQVREIPVTFQKPIVKIRTEKVPIQKTTYLDEERVRKVPVSEVTYERVEKIEPYEVSTCKWVAETREIKIPKTVAKRVDYEVIQTIPRTVLKRVAVDAWGNIITQSPVTTPSWDEQREVLSTVVRRIESPVTEETQPKIYHGKPIFLDPTDSNSAKPRSVLIPETNTETSEKTTEMTPVTPKPKNSVTPESEAIATSGSLDTFADTKQKAKPEPQKTEAADAAPNLNGPSKSDDQ